MKLYELVGKDRTQGFSPYVWRIRMAIAHKGLDVEMVPLIFTEIADFKETEAKTVPILEHGGKFISDSWTIANYLEENFPDTPSLFGDKTGQVYANFFNYNSFYNVLIPMFQALVYDIFQVIDPKDQAYFRSTREATLGKSLEEAAEHQDEAIATLRRQFWPYNQILRNQPYFNGYEPAYVDYIMYGLFQWAKGVSPATLLKEKDALYDWRTRMDDLFDGLGQTIKARAEV